MEAQVLEALIKFTDQAHANQKRKYTDERYIVHPIRVMQTVQQYLHDPPVLAAAMLHDVLEDTPVSKEEIASFLRQFFSDAETKKTIQLVVELTDTFTKGNYPRLNRRTRREKEFERLALASPEAQTIKYADIIDNSVNIMIHDPDFGVVYLKESARLLKKIPKGNAVLYERALHTIKEGLDSVDKTVER